MKPQPERIHVFIDNSNIFGGAQDAARKYESHVPWQAIRVYIRNLVKIVEADRAVATRIMAGSVPPGNDELWQHAKAQGYNTDLLKRVEADDGRLKEQGVDEMLHLKMATALLDSDTHDRLVLVTGDGKTSDYGTSFPGMAERALRKGWKVEVWSWKAALSRNWSRSLTAHSGEMSLHELDPFYFSITFVKDGAFIQKDGSTVYVAKRVVSKIPIGLTVKRA